MGMVVKNGTPFGSESQCESCKFAQIIRGFRESEEITYCIYNEQIITVPFKVHSCSKHIHKSRPSWSQMEDLAIEINPSSTLKSAGFLNGEDPETDSVTMVANMD